MFPLITSSAFVDSGDSFIPIPQVYVPGTGAMLGYLGSSDVILKDMGKLDGTKTQQNTTFEWSHF